jgi:hypothetical protein
MYLATRSLKRRCAAGLVLAAAIALAACGGSRIRQSAHTGRIQGLRGRGLRQLPGG